MTTRQEGFRRGCCHRGRVSSTPRKRRASWCGRTGRCEGAAGQGDGGVGVRPSPPSKVAPTFPQRRRGALSPAMTTFEGTAPGALRRQSARCGTAHGLRGDVRLQGAEGEFTSANASKSVLLEEGGGGPVVRPSRRRRPVGPQDRNLTRCLHQSPEGALSPEGETLTLTTIGIGQARGQRADPNLHCSPGSRGQ